MTRISVINPKPPSLTRLPTADRFCCLSQVIAASDIGFLALLVRV